MIGRNGERGSGISALAARHDDDDDDKYRFCLHSVKCQNSSISNYSVLCKYSFNVKKQFPFK